MGAMRAGRPLRTLLSILAAVFAADVTIMAFLGIFGLGLSAYIAIEAVILAVVLTPVLYIFVHVPLSKDIRQRLNMQSDLEVAQKTIEEYAGNLEGLVEKKIGEVLRAEEALRESEAKFKAISEKSHVGVYIIQDGKFVYANPRIAEMLGYFPAELQGENPEDFIFPDDRPLVREQIRKRVNGEADSVNYEFRGLSKNGEIIHTEAYGSVMAYKGRPAVAGMLIDITARKNAEEALKESEERYRRLVDSSPVPVIVHADWKIVYANPAAEKAFGATAAAELIGRDLLSIAHPVDSGIVQERASMVYAGAHPPAQRELRFVKLDGTAFHVMVSGVPVRFMDRPAALVMFEDITGRKKAEELLREKETLLTESQRIAHIGSWKVVLATGELIWTEEMYRIFGLAPGSPLPDLESSHDLLIHPDDSPAQREWVRACLAGERPGALEFRIIRPDGAVRTLSGQGELRYDENGKPAYLIGNAQDITEKKETLVKIQRLNRLYSMLSAINEMIIRAKDRETLMREACRISVEAGLFKMAWVGMIDKETRLIIPAASCGFEEGYLDKVRISINPDTPEGKGPTGTALRNGTPVICNDIETAEYMGPWREEALKRGYRSSAAFPFRISGQVEGTMNFYAEKSGHFDEDEVRLLEEVANDISYALESFGREKLRKEAEGKIKDKVEELEKFYEMAVGRELKMKELKKEIERLKAGR